MGWMVDGDDGVHEGWVAMLDPKGRGASGWSGAGLIFPRRDWSYGDPDDAMSEVVPWSEVAGWRVQCECGWRGTEWRLGDVRPVDPDEEDSYPEYMLLPDGRTLEEVGHEEWVRHVQPTLGAITIREAAIAAREAQDALDDAVAAARRTDPPTTWEQIGRAVGISRQSAHDRWKP